MQSEQDKILRMVEEGTISADEAQELFEAMEDSEADQDSGGESFAAPESSGSGEVWRRPFGFSLIVATIGGSLLFRTRRASGFTSLLRGVILIPITMLAATAALITYLSKGGPWLHIRIRSAEGKRVSVNLPFPLHILRGGLEMVRAKVSDDEIGEKIDMATEFLEAVETSRLADPISIDVMDEGNKVQIFLS